MLEIFCPTCNKKEKIAITFNTLDASLIHIDTEQYHAADAICLNGTWYSKARKQKNWAKKDKKIQDKVYKELTKGI